MDFRGGENHESLLPSLRQQQSTFLTMMRFSAFISLALVSCVQGDVLSLTAANWEEKTAGKTVFVKFFAPWCGHCQAMAEDWEKLAEAWKDHPTGLVAEVDCTEEESFCQEMSIEGFPTLFYGDASAPRAYEGERDFESLSAFATENLVKRFCSVYALDACTDEEKAVFAELESKSLDELEAKLAEVEGLVNVEQESFQEKVEKLQKDYDQYMQDYKSKIEEIHVSTNYHFVQTIVKKKEHERNEEGEGAKEADIKSEL